jgi:NAD(P)-dependent dehydrogenase (short-subunit alcohol dehydrogenase family)
MKTIFITGASSGLGKASAKLFASKGWNVIATMRNPEKEQELSQLPNVMLLPLDVTNPEQIKSTVRAALAIGDIDVVFNNAGYMLAGPVEGTTDEQLVRQVNTNFLGVVRVTQAFIPYFREKKSGLFIITTSLGAFIPEPFMSLYQATKRALEGWIGSVYFELSKFGIGIKSIVPGFMKTDIATRSLDMARHEAYSTLLNQVVAFFSSPQASAGALDPAVVAEVVFTAATDGKNQLKYLAGAEPVKRIAELEERGVDATREIVDHMFFG